MKSRFETFWAALLFPSLMGGCSVSNFSSVADAHLEGGGASSCMCVPAEDDGAEGDDTRLFKGGKNGKGDNDDPGPPAPGASTQWYGAPGLQPGMGPETANECPANPDIRLPGAPTPGSGVVRECFEDTGDFEHYTWATVERVLESIGGEDYVHVRLTFSPFFVDNTWGANAHSSWGNKGQEFSKLVGSDHATMQLVDGNGQVAMEYAIDYISEVGNGYASNGVTAKDGEVIKGNASDVLAATTSLDRNFNACGYNQGSNANKYIESSPPTDDNYSSSAEAPNWDYRVAYEIWVKASAFGSAGFDSVNITHVHASPSKTGENTIVVTQSTDCPPDTPPPGGGSGTPNDPGSDNPGSDNPGSDDPGSDDPGSDDPGSDNPGSDNPDSDNPGSDNPDSDNPDSDNPGSDNPGECSCPDGYVPADDGPNNGGSGSPSDGDGTGDGSDGYDSGDPNYEEADDSLY